MSVLQDNLEALPSLERVYQAAMVNAFPQSGGVAQFADASDFRFYIDPNILFIEAGCNSLTLHRIFKAGATSPVAVIHECGKIVGT